MNGVVDSWAGWRPFWLLAMAAVVVFAVAPQPAWAQEAEVVQEETAVVEEEAPETAAQDPAADEAAAEEAAATAAEAEEPLTLEGVAGKADVAALAGHISWMLTSCVLVLFMTAPGLAMFYGGLVRKKNVLGVMMQCVFLMGLMTILWAIYGYSLSFGGSGAYVGSSITTATAFGNQFSRRLPNRSRGSSLRINFG